MCQDREAALGPLGATGWPKVLDPRIQDPRHKTFSEAQIWLTELEIPFFRRRCSILRHKCLFLGYVPLSEA